MPLHHPSQRQKQLWRVTPFFVLSIIALLYLLLQWLTSPANNVWGYRLQKGLAPTALGMLAIDLLLKWLLPRSRPIFWIESALLLVLVYWWIVS